ncbi:MAG: helix-turn-helix domain-containing protein [Bacteroidetes bacterium]|nr:helix-turn-helix domain-containing protein [Fibrella sp.]
MNYEQIQPPDYLKHHVRYFWRLESFALDTGPKTFRIIADGCPGLLLHHSENGACHQHNNPLPTAFLYGQSTQSTELQSPPAFRMIGVCFHPNVLPVFGIDAHDLTDSCINVAELPQSQGSRLVDLLLNSSSAVDQIDQLATCLWDQIQKNKAPFDSSVQYAIGRISDSQGNILLRDLYQTLQVSERSLERKFKQVIGISPKLFSRICRFQASLNQVRTNTYDRLSDVAFDHGYADQSHFIRGFNQFAGFSPDQYRKQLTEVVPNFPELTL